MRRTRTLRKTAVAKKTCRPTMQPTQPPTPAVMGSRLAFALYAIGMIGGLGTITALIEKAAP